MFLKVYCGKITSTRDLRRKSFPNHACKKSARRKF